MNYDEYRHKIKNGDVLAWTHKGWGSLYDIQVSLIRLFTMSEYTHVGIAWVFRGRIFVIESVVPYVRIVPLSNLLPCYVIHMESPIAPDALTWGLSMVGKAPYSKWEAIKALWGTNKDPSKWQCVEFVKEMLRQNGTVVGGKDTPSELVSEIQKLGKEMVFIEKP